MALYERYVAGQTIEVYENIDRLGQSAFELKNFTDVEKVLTETFQRVAYNLQIIYDELNAMNYQFKTTWHHNFDRPLHPPLPETEAMLTALDEAVKPFGFVPLSLKYFYRIVGGVNFVWDYETDDNIIWEMADAVQIASLDALVEPIKDKYWHEDMEGYFEDGVAFLQLSADVYHKDNISGGPAYALSLTETPTVDSILLYEPNETTFINYLRICFEYGGFPGLAVADYPDGFAVYLETVRPKLKRI